MSDQILSAQLCKLGEAIDAKDHAGFGSIFAQDGVFTFGKLAVVVLLVVLLC